MNRNILIRFRCWLLGHNIMITDIKNKCQCSRCGKKFKTKFTPLNWIDIIEE